MKPISPVMKRFKHLEVVYAKDQPEYLPLPALPVNPGDETGTVITRWRLTWRERLRVLFGGDLYLWMLTFNKPLQPVRPTFDLPKTSLLSPFH